MPEEPSSDVEIAMPDEDVESAPFSRQNEPVNMLKSILYCVLICCCYALLMVFLSILFCSLKVICTVGEDNKLYWIKPDKNSRS